MSQGFVFLKRIKYIKNECIRHDIFFEFMTPDICESRKIIKFKNYYHHIIIYSDVIYLAENNTTDNVKEGISNIVPTLRSYLRILKLARKPTRTEFLTIAKVAAAGIIAIGVLGFLFFVLMEVIPQYFIPRIGS